MVSNKMQITEAPSRAGSLTLVGGAVALDFANTSSGRGGPMHQEHLRVPHHVVDWAEHAGVVDAPTAERMRVRLNDPGFASFLGDAVSLREAIHRVAATLAMNGRPPEDDVAFIKSWCARAIAAADLAPGNGDGDGFIWSWPTDPPIPETVLGPIALSAVGIMRDSDLSRVKQCGGEHCGWVFFDLTKNRSRRWCEMSVCGNRAKSKRFRASKVGE
jgi:predicted RNA-binding Zn ribbon-like protein